MLKSSIIDTIPNHFFRVSIKALVLDGMGRFSLFLEESGSWELPGGGLDHDETPRECLVRELREEAGLEIVEIAEYPSYFVMGKSSNGKPKVNIIYQVSLRDLHFIPSDECQEVRFFTKEVAQKEHLLPTTESFVRQFTPERQS